MWIADALIGLGISAENAASKLGTMGGVVPLQWPAGLTGSLLHRLPRDAGQRASLFAKQQVIVINEGEVAVVLEDGRSHGSLAPGRYTFTKARVVGQMDVIWIKTGQQSLRWGIGNVASADQVQVSATGTCFLRVVDAEAFNREVIQGANTFAELDLQRFLLPRLQGVLRAAIPKFGALELQQQREAFTEVVTQGLSTVLPTLGLGLVGFEVVEVSLPAEFKAAIAEATMVSHTGRAAVLQATVAAQVKQLEAQAQAQASLLQGQAQLQLMAQMQSQGVDPLRMKALEALQSFAEHPAEGVVSDPRAGLFGTVAMAALSGAGPASPHLAPLMLPPAVPPAPPPTVVNPSPPSPSSAPPSPEEQIADLERQFDALVERLAEGKISEETYQKLSERLESRIARLKS
jgi:regulator of protease activity HflC (stomatin/prohibitin superfamily)